nr:protein takeout-like [Onthophagus taurus]
MKLKKVLVSNEMSYKIAFAFLCLFVSSFGKDLPPFIERCGLSDPKLRNCLVRSIQNAAPSIIVPFNIPFIEIKIGDGAKITLANSNYTAFKTMKVQDAGFDKETGEFYLKYIDAKMDAISYYEMDIKFLGSNIKGNGPLLLNFTDSFITYTTKLKVFTDKKGIERYGVEGGKTTFSPTGAKFDFQNLFNGNKSLGKATNRLLNENWKDLFGILQPTFQQVLAGIMDNAFKKYLKYVPKNAVFLP